jgi:hypothetical protein
MIRNALNRILGRDSIYVVQCTHENQYQTLYYAVESKTKTNAIRKVIAEDQESKNHKIKSVIDDDIFISKDEMYYISTWLRFSTKHILIMAPGDMIENIIKYKYPHEDGISAYRITKMLQ